MKNFEDYGIRVSGSGEQRTTCPQCSSSRTKQNDKCLSVNVDDGVWYCHHCEWTGGLERKTTYTPITVKNKPIEPSKQDRFYEWFAKRKITKDTLDSHKVSLQGSEIAFNYYISNDLVNVKYRSKDKKFRQTKGGFKCFYNLQKVGFSDYVIITEGEIDALSYAECDLISISVPTGGGKQKHDYIENSLPYLKSVKTFYLSIDNDEKGKELENELARRFGKANCKVIDLEGCKDANEYLTTHGAFELALRFEEAEPYPVEFVHNAIDYWDSVLDYFENGVTKEPTSKLIDEKIYNLDSQFMLVTGVPSHGKTTFMLNYLVRIAAYSGWKVGLFSPEHSAQNLIMKLIQIYSGKGLNAAREELKLDYDHIEESKSFINDNFFFIESKDGLHKLELILEAAKYLVLAKGIKVLFVDSWMKIYHESGKDKQEYITNTLNQFSKFCKDYGVTLIMIAHPRKMEKQGDNFLVPTAYDISDSKSFYDIPDVILVVFKRFVEGEFQTEIHIRKVRDEGLTGETGILKNLYFNSINQRFDVNSHTFDKLQALNVPDVPF